MKVRRREAPSKKDIGMASTTKFTEKAQEAILNAQRETESRNKHNSVDDEALFEEARRRAEAKKIDR